ncbi:hypothetical protein [Pseudidiomarina salilacus]|uniref:hypothetical protein n=1 Tax=Pseudidiomarina salilacus TaxID=3384452 RepID=UPI0039856A93
MLSLNSSTFKKIMHRTIVGAVLVMACAVVLPPLIKGPSDDAPYANIPSTGLLLAILALVFFVSQVSRKFVLQESAKIKYVSTKFVSLTPDARRKRLMEALIVCGLAVPVFLFILLSSQEPSPLLLLLIPIVIVAFSFYATLIPALFNSAEFREETIELDGVQTGKVIIPFDRLLSVGQKRSWVSVLSFDPQGDLLVVTAEDAEGQPQEHRIRLLRGMVHRELFIGMLKDKC